MGKLCLTLIILFLALILHSKARNLPSDIAKEIKNSLAKQTIVHANAPAAAESPASTGLKDEKNFIYGGVGGFAGMGGYAGMVGGVPVLGGVGGIGKYGGLGGVGGLGGYNGLGGLGSGAGGGGLGGEPGGSGGAGGGKGGGGGLFPCP